MYYQYQSLKKRVLKMYDKLPPEAQIIFGAFFSGVFMALVRVLAEEGTFKAKGLEAITCGFIATSAAFLVLWMNYDVWLAIFLGSTIGHIGSDQVKQTAIRFLRKKSD